MTAQGVTGSSASNLNSVLAGFSAPDVSVKGANGTSFEAFMTTSKESGVQETSKKKVNGMVKDITDASAAVKDRAKEFFSGECRVKEAEGMQNTEQPEAGREEIEAVSMLLLQVQQVICSELGITEEELSAAMEELGMSTKELLDRSNLQELFLRLQNVSEPTELLTDEELFGSFTDLLQAVDQALWEAGVAPETVKTVLREAKALTVSGKNEPEETVETAVMSEKLQKAEKNSDGPQNEGTEEQVDTQTATVRNGVRTETQTAEGGTGNEKHTVSAREDGKDTVISSETDANVRNVFIDTLANVSAGAGEEAVEAAAQLRDIADQIMEQIKIVIKPDQTNMELQLNPEHLGRVHLTITEKEGMMTAQFTTQSEVAKEAIESQMAALRESLQNQGIKVESIEVTVSEFGFERDRDAKQNAEEESGKQKRRSSFRVEESDETASGMTDFMNVTDSSVDYSA